LTTYFEGEIIGSKYGFITKHDSWGATEKVDLNHWNKFSAFRPIAKQNNLRKSDIRAAPAALGSNPSSSSGPSSPAGSPGYSGGQIRISGDYTQKESLFMRWKERFLVPDHRVKTINGASFEGFYYICFNQTKGTVSGIYFHSKSEK
jgi:glucose-induced degradation protein 4